MASIGILRSNFVFKYSNKSIRGTKHKIKKNTYMTANTAAVFLKMVNGCIIVLR